MQHTIQNSFKAKTLLLLIPTIIIFYLIAKSGIQFAYDAGSYLNDMSAYQEHGIAYHNASFGYRSYLFPYLFSLLPVDYSKSISMGEIVFSAYTATSIGIFLLIETLIIYIMRGMKYFYVFYFALFANPLVLVFVGYPLQESFIILLFVLFIPLIYTSFIKKNDLLMMLWLGAFLGTMYMARSSQVILIVPIASIALYNIYRTQKSRILLLTIFVASSILFIAPQSYMAYQNFGTINPYPQTAVLNLQFQYGNVYSKYATNISGNPKLNPAQPYWNPLSCKTETSSDARNYRIFTCQTDYQEAVVNFSTAFQNNSSSNLFFKSALHIFNALNYDYFKPYITKKLVKIFTWHQLLSMTIVYFGLFSMIRMYITGTINRFQILLDGILLLSLGILLFFSIETRFGLLATVIFSIKSMDLLICNKPSKSEWFILIYGWILFLLASSLLSVYIVSLSGALTL